MDRTSIEILLKDNEDRHSDFQIENFIIKNQGDTWAQYKQCLREISSRYESIKNDEGKARAAKVRIKQSIRFKIWRFINRKKIADKEFELKSLETVKSTKNLKAELSCLIKLARELKKQIGEIDSEKRYELETETWKNKGLKMAAIDILSTGHMSTRTYEFIFSLPKQSQTEILKRLSIMTPMESLGFTKNEITVIANGKR